MKINNILLITIFMILGLEIQSQEYIGVFGPPNSGFIFIDGPTQSVGPFKMTKSTNTSDDPDAGPLTVSASYTQNLYTVPSWGTDGTSAHPALMFGGEDNNGDKELNGKPLIVRFDDVGDPSSSYYSPVDGQNGMNPGSHFAFEHLASIEYFEDQDNQQPRAGFATDGSHKMGEITYTFSRLVENPVLHLTGLGGAFGSTAFNSNTVFSVRYRLKTGGGVTGLNRLSGTTRFVVSGSDISNPFDLADFESPGNETGASGDSGGTGSVEVQGIFTSVTFEVFMDGKTPPGPNVHWATVLDDGNAMTIDDGGNQLYTGDRYNTSWSLPPSSILPVTLSRFDKVMDENCNVELSWASKSEINASHFEIEVSTDGNGFSRIGTIKSTGSGSNYNYELASALGYKYARLKMVDIDGYTKYSSILNIKGDCLDTPGILSIFPNPIQRNNKLNLQYFADSRQTTFQIVDLQGKLVSRQIFGTNASDVNNIQLDLEGLEAGLYMVISPEGKAKRIIVTR